MISTSAEARRRPGSGSGVADAATASLRSVPGVASAGTASVITTLAVSPGRSAPTVQGRVVHTNGEVGTTDARVVPAGIWSSNETAAAVEGPSLVTVRVYSTWPPAATASPVATLVSAR